MAFDPISTVLATALFIPAVPTSGRYTAQVFSPVSKAAVSATDHPVLQDSPATAYIFNSSTPPILDLREAIARQVEEYAQYPNQWDGPDSVAPAQASIAAAKTFLQKIPGGLVLPAPMLGSNGEVGYYWNLQGGYADVNFDESGRASLFVRLVNGIEQFSADLNVAELSRDWFFNALGEICAPVEIAA